METNHASPLPRVEFTLQYEKGDPKLLQRNPQTTSKTPNQMEYSYMAISVLLFAADSIVH